MSKLLLKEGSVAWAIDHLVAYGDTDIFPRPIELKFFAENKEKISADLANNLDLHTYKPVGIIDSLVPKSKLGFRTGHQLFPVDCLLLTAAVHEIGPALEAARRPADEGIAFSYRFQPQADGSMFASDHKFIDWLENQWRHLITSDDYDYVIRTDISDFFQRIYHHRIENCLNEYTSGSKLAKFVFRLLKEYTARQSFGLPVGADFSRLIAEIVLNDTDEALVKEGFDFTRYVDDIVIFNKKGQSYYGALSFLAEHLSRCEGLTLSAQKTKIAKVDEYIASFDFSEGAGNDDSSAHELIRYRFLDVYDNEELDPEKVEKLVGLDLPQMLAEEVEKDIWDHGKIRVILRALKLIKSTACVDYIKQKFPALLPFIKDVVLLMDELNQEHPGIFADMRERIIAELSGATCQALPSVRAWIFEILIRKIVPFDLVDMRRITWSIETLDRRQITLLHYTCRDMTYFRSRKTRLSEMNTWELTYFIYGSTCLPRDEFEVFVNNVRKRELFPLSDVYLDWCISLNKSRVFEPSQRAPSNMKRWKASSILDLEIPF